MKRVRHYFPLGLSQEDGYRLVVEIDDETGDVHFSETLAGGMWFSNRVRENLLQFLQAPVPVEEEEWQDVEEI